MWRASVLAREYEDWRMVVKSISKSLKALIHRSMAEHLLFGTWNALGCRNVRVVGGNLENWRKSEEFNRPVNVFKTRSISKKCRRLLSESNLSFSEQVLKLYLCGWFGKYGKSCVRFLWYKNLTNFLWILSISLECVILVGFQTELQYSRWLRTYAK